MIRALLFLAVLGGVALGLGWLADQPGDVVVNFRDHEYTTTPLKLALILIAIAFTLTLVLMALAWLLRTPRRWRASSRARKQAKGLDALTRGLVAAGAGDVRNAQKESANAAKHLGAQPLTMLLEAQAHMLAGDRAASEQAFAKMAEHPQTRVLGLRGLHVEAKRRGDADAAHAYAEAAHRIAPLPWAGDAVLDHHAARQDWTRALAAVDANLAQKTIDRPTANRQRAVLQTAIALDIADREPDEALKLASHAISLAPDLAPASALAGRLLARRGDVRKASRLLEAAWKQGPHPDIADVYLDLRSGDSSADRLKRAQSLARLAPDDAESSIALARAAIAAREFPTAREAMARLIDASTQTRPSSRVCMIMADLEEAEHGPSGAVREWLARASRAPRDKAWVADGVVSDVWAPFSPVSGKLDAWKWQTPPERLSAAWSSSDPPAPEALLHGPVTELAPASHAPPREIARVLPLASPPDDPGTARA